MRILHVLDHSLPEATGYSLRSHHIIVEQRRRGWSTFQVTGPRQPHAAGGCETVEGLEFFRTTSSMPGWAARPPIDFLWTIGDLRARVRNIIDQISPDVIHAHSPCSNGLAVLGLGRPVVYEMRTLWEEGSVLAGRLSHGGVAHRVARGLETFVLRRADAVVVISEGLRAEVLSRGVLEGAVTVVPNAVAWEELPKGRVPDRDAARRRFALRSTHVLGYIGSLFAWEGLRGLLESLRQLRASGVDAEVLIVGTGPEESGLRVAAKELGIDAHVVFAGAVPHAAAIEAYDAIDVLVYPRLPIRLTEAVTPLKPLEAMAVGKALVASDVGGHRELIDDGETGVLFRAGDAEALAAAVRRIIDDPALAQRLRESGPPHVRERRLWSGVVAAYEPLYRSLMQRRAAWST